MIDPRPYTYEYRKPRLNNPTLYFLNDNQSIFERVWQPVSDEDSVKESDPVHAALTDDPGKKI